MNTRYTVLTLLSVTLLAACDTPSAPSAELLPLRSSAAATAVVNAVTLQPQETHQLTARMSGSRSRTIAWTSDNAGVATVSRAGLITAVSGGTASIAAVSGNVSESWLVSVRVPTRLDVQRSSEQPMTIGNQTNLTAMATDGGGAFTPRSLTWRVDSGTSVSVTNAGLATAVRNGTSVVSATSSGVVGRIRLQVGTITPTALTLTPGSAVVAPNGQVQFNASVTWSDGTTSAPSVTYSASGGAITSAGLFTAGSQTGSYTVTATCACGVSSTVTVTVQASTGVGPNIVPPQAPALYNPGYPTRTGSVIRVNAGDNLQTALNAAQPGDEIVLANGATFTGNFVLPAKSASSNWIVVRSETVPTSEGTRISPAAAPNLASVVTPNAAPAFVTQSGAKRWRLVGLRVRPVAGLQINYGLVVLGNGENTRSALPTNIVLDRMIIMGQPNDNVQRCVAFNADSLAIIDSWVTECHGRGFDAQAVGGWNGGGPFLIQNNRLEGSGETIMFGGADPYINGLSPSDIVIRRNYLYRPTSWANGRWTVKNHFELKHARRVVFESNVVENNWADAQNGFIILLQTLSDNNTAWAWTTVRDVRIENNILRNSTSGMNLGARVAYDGGPLPTNPSTRIMLKNNLFQKVGIDPISGAEGRLLALYNDLSNTSILNNTFTSDRPANSAIIMDGVPMSTLVVTGNVFAETAYGIHGTGTSGGTRTLEVFAPNAVLQDNVFPGQAESRYPSGNWFPATTASVTFQNASGGDFSLTSANAFFMGVFGRVGINMTALSAATGGVTN